MNNKIMPWLLLFVMMLYRPTIFGLTTTTFAVVFTFALIILFNTKISISLDVFKMSLAVAVFFLYDFLISIVHLKSVYTDNFKAIISIIMLMLLVDTFLRDKYLSVKFIKLFICMLVFFSISCLVTEILMMLTRNESLLRYFDYYEKSSDYHVYILYPFTPAYGRKEIGGFLFVRLTALFRECGIAQLFYIWAYSEAPYYFKKSILRFIRIFLFLGVCFCLSTTGFINLMAYYILNLIFKMKRSKTLKQFRQKIGVILLLGVAVLLSNSIPDMSFSDKNPISLSARIAPYSEIWKLFQRNPMGIICGYSVRQELGTLSLFQQIYRIGILGIMLYAVIPFIAYRKAEDKKRFILANCAGFITLLFSQPIWMAPIVVMMWILPYEKVEK